MTERTRSRPSTVAAVVAPGAAALLSAATAFVLQHNPAPAAKAAPVEAAAPGTRTDDVAVARLRRQAQAADAELTRLRAQWAQVNSELAKAGSAPVPPRAPAAGPPAEVVPVALEHAAPPAQAAPPPPVDASTGAS
jgi:hypothetical protein